MATATETTAQTAATDDPWGMEVPAPSDGEYVLCPKGNYPATVVALVDVGTHTEENDKGENKKVRKLVVAFELKKLKEDGKPFMMAERCTFSMSEKAKFYGLVANITGIKFKEGEKFDPRSLLGRPVMLNVTHTETSKNGKTKTYHNIGNVSQFPEGFDAPTPTIEPYAWSIRSATPIPSFDDLPYVYGESVKTLCERSDEGKARAQEETGTPF